MKKQPKRPVRGGAKKVARKKNRQQTWKYAAGALFVLVIALIGSLYLFKGHAATPYLKVFSAEEETSSPSTPLSSSIATQQAKGLDLIIANSTTYKNYVTDLKNGNSSIKLWCYLNATEAQTTQGPASGVYPTSWYATQANGYYLRNKSFGNWLMDPTNSGWRNSRLQAAQNCINNNGYDSIFWDVLGPGPISWSLYNPVQANGTVVSGVSAEPVNVSTGQQWTRSGWLNATGSFVAWTQTSLGRPLGGNGLVSGQEYYNTAGPTSVLFTSGGNNMMPENFLRTATQSASTYPSEAIWKQNVDMLVNAGQQGKTVLAYTKVWTSDTQAAKDAVHKYALASFMLGTDGNSYFSFRYDHDRVMGYPWWDKTKTIGSPVNSYYLSGNSAIYERDFSAGKVFVDPTGTATSVSLGADYTNLDGTTVNTLNFDASNRAEIVFTIAPTTTTPPPTTTTTDTTAPVVTLTTPTSGATLAGSITVTGTATDNKGVSKVNLFVDGALMGSSTGGGSFSFVVNTTQLINASHFFTVHATDDAGNVGTATISATVNNVVKKPSNGKGHGGGAGTVISAGGPSSGTPVATSGVITVTGAAGSPLAVTLDGKTTGTSIDTAKLTNGIHVLTVSQNGHSMTQPIAVHNIWPVAVRNEIAAHLASVLAGCAGVAVAIALLFRRRLLPVENLFKRHASSSITTRPLVSFGVSLVHPSSGRH